MNSGYKMAAVMGAIFGFTGLLIAAVALIAAADDGSVEGGRQWAKHQ